MYRTYRALTRRAGRLEDKDMGKQANDWRTDHPGHRAEREHSFIDSWYFLVPLGVMCIGILLWQAGVL